VDLKKTAVKDTDYLYITSLVRAKEPALLTDAARDRMIEARTDDEAARVLEECGFPDMSELDSLRMESRLSAYLDDILADFVCYVPRRELVEVFRLKYDYHNAKVLIKAQAADVGGGPLLSGSGRFDPEALTEQFYQGSSSGLPKVYADALWAARDELSRTKDAQRADFILDRAYFAELRDLAEQAESPFLTGYCAALIDSANLRAAVRVMMMALDPALLTDVLVSGGAVQLNAIAAAVRSGEGLAELYGGSLFAKAAAAGAEAARSGGSLTLFEKLCDNAVTNYLQSAKRVSFGDGPVIAFLAAVEAEITSVRIIMNGRAAGLEPERIRERLRDSYV